MKSLDWKMTNETLEEAGSKMMQNIILNNEPKLPNGLIKPTRTMNCVDHR